MVHQLPVIVHCPHSTTWAFIQSKLPSKPAGVRGDDRNRTWINTFFFQQKKHSPWDEVKIKIFLNGAEFTWIKNKKHTVCFTWKAIKFLLDGTFTVGSRCNLLSQVVEDLTCPAVFPQGCCGGRCARVYLLIWIKSLRQPPVLCAKLQRRIAAEILCLAWKQHLPCVTRTGYRMANLIQSSSYLHSAGHITRHLNVLCTLRERKKQLVWAFCI